jgi:hypothetical protein
LDLIAHVHPDGEGSNNEDENQTGVEVSDHALGISIHKNVALEFNAQKASQHLAPRGDDYTRVDRV